MQHVDFNQLLNEVPLYTAVQCSGFLNESLIEKQKLLASATSITSSRAIQRTTSISTSLKPQLYCDSESCMNYTFFRVTPTDQLSITLPAGGINQLIYKCCNCGTNSKTFFLKFEPSDLVNPDNETVFTIEKIGQSPRHGQPLPKKASKLIGGERDLFFKGSISENQGMGIGAFSYYRRVIDAKKDRIFDEIIKVLKLSSGNAELIQELQAAQAETQFTKAVEKIKTALPDSFKIHGQNPLTLLYSALSEGLHTHTDDECLQLAQGIKIVFFELSEKLDSLLKENSELSDAVKMLIALKSKP
jgi:hypothetical protein